MSELQLGKQLRMPLELATQTTSIIGLRGSGKRLAIDTPLATPNGWVTMGEIKVGDKVFDDEGRSCNVIYVSPVVMGDTYRVKFDDGTSLLADAEHLWLTDDIVSRRTARNRAKPFKQPDWGKNRPQCRPTDKDKPKVRTTKEIAKTLKFKNKVKGEFRYDTNHSITNAKPLQLPRVKLPVDPYVLGAWLGDGTKANSQLTAGESGVLELLNSKGQPSRLQPSTVKGKTASYCLIGLMPKLRKLGVLKNKHIPVKYLRASVKQRLSLLQGLMDTDGGWGAVQAEISLSDKRLAEDVFELVVSLGMKASWSSRIPMLKGKPCNRSYRIRFSPTTKVFLLPRKSCRLNFNCSQQVKRKRRYIVAVTKVKNVLMRCIEVDSPSHLYLAGKSMVPTHNTNTASVIVEELLDNNIPVLIIDPTDAWYGLLSSKSGKQEGYPVAVFGGQHGHMPVSEHDGKTLAEFCVLERVPMVLSIRHLRKGAQRRLVRELFEELYHLKGKPENRTPLTVVIDEAPLFIPQVVKGDEALVVGAVEDLVNRGRNAGLGVVLISQRSATINKNVFDMSEAMIVHRSTGPRDRKAFKDWIEENVSVENLNDVLSSLAELKDGEAWVWSPKLGIFGKYQIRERKTYDSSRTPRIGEIIESPKKFAEIDHEKLKAKLEANLREAKANDPKTLKSTIAELEKQLKIAKSAAADVEVVSKQIAEALHHRTNYLVDSFVSKLNTLATVPIRDFPSQVEAVLSQLSGYLSEDKVQPAVVKHKPTIVPQFTPKQPPAASAATQRNYTEIHKAILNSLAWWTYVMKNSRPTKLMVATVAGYACGRYFNDSVGQLKTANLVYSDAGSVSLTPEGSQNLPVQNLPSDPNFHTICSMVRSVLPGGAHVQLFDSMVAKCKANPSSSFSMSDAELAEVSGYSTGRYFNDTKGNLKNLGFFRYPEKGRVALSELFHPFLGD